MAFECNVRRGTGPTVPSSAEDRRCTRKIQYRKESKKTEKWKWKNVLENRGTAAQYGACGRSIGMNSDVIAAPLDHHLRISRI